MKANFSRDADRWKRCASDSIEILSCGGDFVAYHRPSGKTHLLNESSYRLLTVVMEDEPTFPEIVDRCVPLDSESDRGELLDHLGEMLENLEQLGLLERL